MMRSLKKNRKKGFTLVELIVVLVILAILAALLIPALTGYIDKAKEKQVVAEARQIVMAAQTLLDEEYGKNVPNGSSSSDIKFAANNNANAYGVISIEDVAALSEVTLTWSDNEVEVTSAEGTVNIVVGDGNTVSVGTISKVTYKAHGVLCTYDKTEGEYVIKKN